MILQGKKSSCWRDLEAYTVHHLSYVKLDLIERWRIQQRNSLPQLDESLDNSDRSFPALALPSLLLSALGG